MNADIVAILVIVAFFGFCLYLVVKIKNFFIGLFSGSSKPSYQNSKILKSGSGIKNREDSGSSLTLLSDVVVRNGYQLETINSEGRSIKSMQLSANEELAGFSENFFVTVSDYWITTYDPHCHRIAKRQVRTNEEFHQCLSNSFTTYDNYYVTSYDMSCRYLKKRRAT